MLRVFVVIINLALAFGSPEVYGLPAVTADVVPLEFQPEAVLQVEDHHFSVLPQVHDQYESALPSGSHQEQKTKTSPPKPTDQYGLPPDGQSLAGQYSQGAQQSALKNSDKSIHYDLMRGAYDQNQRAFQDLSNEELIASYTPPVVSTYMNEQDSGLEYANYAPYHHAKYVSGHMKSGLPSYHSQTTQNNVKYDIPTYQNNPDIPEYPYQRTSNPYQPSRAQIPKTDISNDYKIVANNNQGATSRQTAESEVPTYQDYSYTQDVQRSDTDAAFQNPSYLYPNYDTPAVVSQNSRVVNPAYQTSISRSQNSRFVPVFASSVDENANPDVSYHRSSNGQKTRYENENYEMTVPRVSSSYRIPDVDGSAYKDSKYDSAANQRHANPNYNYKTPIYQTGDYARYETPAHRNSAIGGRNPEVGSYQSTVGHEIPVRYIAVLQKHRAPGRADISTATYLTHALDDEQQSQDRQSLAGGFRKTDIPIVLPVLSNYHRDSPSGSISSTFISKDVGAYLRQPAYARQVYRDDAQLEASGGDEISNASPQSSYGVPNF